MNLAKAPPKYDPRDQDKVRDDLQREDGKNLKQGERINDTPFILKAPNGNRYVLTVGNTGTLSAVAI